MVKCTTGTSTSPSALLGLRGLAAASTPFAASTGRVESDSVVMGSTHWPRLAGLEDLSDKAMACRPFKDVLSGKAG